LEGNKAKLQIKIRDLDEQQRNLTTQKLNKEKEYKKMQTLNENVVNEIRRLKIDNEDLEKEILSKDQFIKQQQTELVQRQEYRNRIGKKKRFLCC